MKLLSLSIPLLSLAQAPAVPAPDFKLTDTNGKTVQLSALKGKPVVLAFWATWCHVCQEEIPKINAYFKRNPGKFVFVPVHIDPAVGTANIKRWAVDHNWAFVPVVDTPKNSTGFDTIRGAVQRYRVQGTPTFFFIDAQGMIRRINPGGMSEPAFKQALSLIGAG